MYCVKEIKKDIYWVGANDRRTALFENAFPIDRGVSYNSYLILDDKTVLMDCVDMSASAQFFENIEHLLNGRSLDYIIINHMEPDHCATLGMLIEKYGSVKIVGNQKTMTLISQFFSFDLNDRAIIVKEGDSLDTNNHCFKFFMAPMVHWPEVMVTYDQKTKMLYSADAFGTFGALNGHIFADQYDFERDWLDDARRYYTNIVGKFGPAASALLKKAAGLEIEMICPLHGPVWRNNIAWFFEKYQKWSTYTPEKNGVLILYGSIYGNTENAANILAFQLAQAGVNDIAVYDVSKTHASYLVSEAFKYSHIVFASATYNGGIFVNMENVVNDLKAHNLQNRTAAIIQNGSWAYASGELIKKALLEMKNINVLENLISIRSSLKDEQINELEVLACQLTQNGPKIN